MLYISPSDRLLHSWHGFPLPSCQVCPCIGMAEQVHRVSQEVVAGKPLWWGGDTGCCSSTILSGYSCTPLLATAVLELKERPEVWRRNEEVPKTKLCLDCSFWTVSSLYTVSLGIGSVFFFEHVLSEYFLSRFASALCKFAVIGTSLDRHVKEHMGFNQSQRNWSVYPF